jgi:hypothetical protein
MNHRSTDIYRIFQLTVAEYTYFSVAHGIFSKIEHVRAQSKLLTNTPKL